MALTLTHEEATAIRRALDACSDAVDTLRRFHGPDVADVSIAARNVLFETDALGIMARHGYLEGEFEEGEDN